jgi:maltooligosyltrehalose synthase
VQEYLQKALREAKTHSNWTLPDDGYEGATKAFAVALLDESKPFWKSFEKLHKKVADFGIVNSLAQVLLKFTCPGLPDVYQGTELWDFSLVDPDNRRAVDYAGAHKIDGRTGSSRGRSPRKFDGRFMAKTLQR